MANLIKFKDIDKIQKLRHYGDLIMNVINKIEEGNENAFLGSLNELMRSTPRSVLLSTYSNFYNTLYDNVKNEIEAYMINDESII